METAVTFHWRRHVTQSILVYIPILTRKSIVGRPSPNYLTKTGLLAQLHAHIINNHSLIINSYTPSSSSFSISPPQSPEVDRYVSKYLTASRQHNSVVIPLVNLARSSLYLARVTLIARKQEINFHCQVCQQEKRTRKKNPPNTQSTSLIPTRRYEEVEWKGGREREKNKKTYS